MNLFKRLVLLNVIITFSVGVNYAQEDGIYVPDLDNGKYKNPIIWADYSDPDIVRVGDDFYMTSSSFNCVPALPVLHSTDLVNWEIINYAVKRFPDPYFDKPQLGNGVWAPSIKFHDGWFYIFWGDPDRGIYMVRTQDPYAEWEAPVLVKKAYGNIDSSPLWDDDGKVYLVHAFANSRAGVSHVLQIQELDPVDLSANSKSRDIVIHGLPDNITLEGPKFYKRNGYYYIFAPAGGVPTGWQMIYRSKNVWGPYEEKKVLEQGDSEFNGPHQGGWVELENGENWFVHFQELQPYGRIIHLQPVKWVNDWPVMGEDEDGDGCGYPVAEYKKPKTGKSEIKIPQTSDEFEGDDINLAWQWHANYYPNWYSLSKNEGNLRLVSQYHNVPGNIMLAPNLLSQKFPAPAFEASTKVDVSNLGPKEKAGLIVLGLDYAVLEIRKSGDENEIRLSTCKSADKGYSEDLDEKTKVSADVIYLSVAIAEGGKCQFKYSVDGKEFTNLGKAFQAREGKWIGAKVGLYAITSKSTGIPGYADFDYFRIEKLPK